MANISGTSAGERLEGSVSDDTLTGSGGDDELYGHEGLDAAVYAGALCDYRITVAAGGVIHVTDINPLDHGDEGYDTLTGIESLVFADQVVSLQGNTGINTATAGNQYLPTLTPLMDGGFVVLWQSMLPDGSGWEICGQRYDSLKQPVSDEFIANSTRAGDQQRPVVTALADGGFMALWQSGLAGVPGYGLRGQRFGSNGEPTGEELLIAGTVEDSLEQPVIAGLPDGGFVAAWMARAPDNQGWSISGQCFGPNSEGLAPPFRITTNVSGMHEQPVLAVLPAGGFVVIWGGEGPGDVFGVFGRRYDADAAPAGEELQVSTTVTGYQWSPAVATLADGSLVIVWQGNGPDDSAGIFGQRLNVSGVIEGPEFRINTTITGDQREPVITALADGGFVVAWTSDDPAAAPVIRAQRFDSAGAPLLAEMAVSPPNAVEARSPAIATLADGGFFVTWMAYSTDEPEAGNWGVYGQYFDPAGRPLVTGPVSGANGSGLDDVLDFIGSTAHVNLQGGAGNDLLQGGSGADVLAGGNGDDTYLLSLNEDRVRENSDQGTDTVIAGISYTLPGHLENLYLTGTESLDAVGNSLNNIMEGNSGNNRLDGKGGDDTVLLEGVPQDYRFNAGMDGAVQVTAADTDQLDNIEILQFQDRQWRIDQEFRINTTTLDAQRAPAISALSSGDLMSVWWGSGPLDTVGIQGRSISAAGAHAGSDFTVNTVTAGEQRYPSVAALADGGSVVTWMSSGQDGSSWGIYGQRYNASGVAVGGEFAVNTTTANSQQFPVAAGLPDGGFVVAWFGYGSGDSAGIFGRRFDGNGIAAGAEFRINNATTGDQRDPAIAVLPDGGFVATWTSRDSDGSTGIAARRYGATGTALADEFMVNTVTSGSQGVASVTSLADGGFLVAWQGNDAALTGGAWPQAAAFSGSTPLPYLSDAAPDGGFTCTGLDRISRGAFAGCWLAGSDGRRIEGTDVAIEGEVLVLSADFSQVLARFTLGLTGGVQGVAVDTSGPEDSFWVSDVRGNFIRHFSLYGDEAGAEITGDRVDYAALSGVAPNGLAYDPDNQALWVGSSSGSTVDLVSCLSGEKLQTRVAGSGLDQLHYDPVNRYLYYSTGNNGVNGEVRAIALDAEAGSFSVYSSLQNAQAIEGIFIDRDQGRLYVLNDGGFHSAASPATNMGLVYDVNVLPPLPAMPAGTELRDDGYNVYGRRYSGDGMAAGTDFRLSETVSADQLNPSVAGLTGGGFVAVWQSQNNDGSGNGVFGQLYSASGLKSGGEFCINTYISSNQDSPIVSALSDGGFVVSWQSLNQDGSNYGVYGRRFNALGRPVTSITGSSLDDVMNFSDSMADIRLVGGSGNDILSGGSGQNSLLGGTGNDRYYPARPGDLVVELAGEGEDYVYASMDGYSLSDNLERLYLLEGSAARSGAGNRQDNLLTGNSADNFLDGNGGADWLIGRTGNDTYVLTGGDDRITELAAQGIDTVLADFSLTLGANLENLTLTGTANLNGIGNTADNILTGNSGNNTLKGYGGCDTLIGGLGDDLYYLDSADDVVTELAGQGLDVVYAKSDYILSANLERLYLLEGSAGVSGNGNADANVLTGNSAANVLSGFAGNDTLNGKAGADTLAGGWGDDRYYVDEAGDVVVELAGEGNDYVYSTASYTLGLHTERLYLLEGYSGALNAAGGSDNNVLTGNSFANVLTGGGGNDSLFGGLGDDTYVLARGDGADTVTDSGGNADALQMAADIQHDQLWLRKSGNNLEVRVVGANDKFTVRDWYTGGGQTMETILAGDGFRLDHADVDLLVAAMATVIQPSLGNTQGILGMSNALDAVLAQVWR